MIKTYDRYRVLRVMLGELGNHDEDAGNHIGRYYSGNREWCAEFVSYCYWQAGVPFDQGSFTSSIDYVEGTWMQRSTTRVVDWFKLQGQYIERGASEYWFEYTPQPGDYVFIGRAKSKRLHSGLVEYVDTSGTLHTIEGNNGGRKVSRYQYPFYKLNDQDNGTANGIIMGVGYR